MSDIEVTVTGDKQLVAKLNNFIGSAGLNLKRSMGASGLYLTNFFGGEAFTSRGRVFGEPWPALNSAYAAYKARTWPGRPPLIRTGLMQRSFKHESTRLTTSLWNEAEYFGYHQDGRGVPQRVMMKVDEQRAARVVKYIVGDITDQMSAEGLI